MSEEERLRLKLILERLNQISAWTANLDQNQFLADSMVRDAVAMSLLVVGETARRLEEETRRRAPEVPWNAITSLRNRIAHGYETVDHRLVWQIVRHDLPGLSSEINRLMSPP
ncbi:MAG: HepT-like ribonuclease domain-containing protein [Caulobacteraceae bacterium]